MINPIRVEVRESENVTRYGVIVDFQTVSRVKSNGELDSCVLAIVVFDSGRVVARTFEKLFVPDYGSGND